MNRAALEQGMLERGCTPQRGRDSYSTRFLRCCCADHSLAAVSCGDEPEHVVKLFGAAVSWHLSRGHRGALTFVIGKDPKGEWDKAAQAIRTIQPVALDVDLQADFVPAPEIDHVDLSCREWVDAMLARGTLPELGRELQEHASIPTFAWYRSVTGSEWSGRLNGLQICTLSNHGTRLTFNVGKAGAQGRNSEARSAFLRVVSDSQLLCGELHSQGQLLLGPGDEQRGMALLQLFAGSELARKGGAEHRLECRILSGEVPLTATEGALQPIAIDHAFQFPTKWWSRGRPRYVDVMARRGAVPWVVELKVGTAQGEYYRDGIVQAALYREFILRSPGLDPWFDHHGLNLSECRAALLIPPLRGPREEQLRADHQRVSRLFGVELIEEPAAVL